MGDWGVDGSSRGGLIFLGFLLLPVVDLLPVNFIGYIFVFVWLFDSSIETVGIDGISIVSGGSGESLIFLGFPLLPIIYHLRFRWMSNYRRREHRWEYRFLKSSSFVSGGFITCRSWWLPGVIISAFHSNIIKVARLISYVGYPIIVFITIQVDVTSLILLIIMQR